MLERLVNSVTVLAPNDAAFQKASNPDSDELQALLRYHAVKGQYVSVTFNEAPAFRATLLTNKKYANVTGGQRVELVRVDNGPVIRSALKKTSQITTAVCSINLRGFISQRLTLCTGHIIHWRVRSYHRPTADDTT